MDHSAHLSIKAICESKAVPIKPIIAGPSLSAEPFERVREYRARYSSGCTVR